MVLDRELRDEHLAPLTDEFEREPRRIVLAQMYLYDVVRRVARGEVLICGGGPTAAWCAEEALRLGNRVWWIADGFASAFPASGRNDRLAVGRVMQRDGRTTREIGPPLPANLWMGGGTPTAIDPAPSRRVRVVVKADPARPPLGRDGRVAHLPAIFDQVIVSMAQDSAPEERGSVAHLTDGLGPWQAITAADGRLAGLQNGDRAAPGNQVGAVRVLGAACFRHPAAGAGGAMETALKRTIWWEQGLSADAQVNRTGFTVCLATIALANRAWADGNWNANTVWHGDLPASAEESVLDQIVVRRSASQGCFELPPGFSLRY